MSKEPFRFPGDVSKAVRENVNAVARLEESFLHSRSLSERIADGIGSFVGSLTFVFLHVVFYGVWIGVNVGWVPGVRKFDPFPFLLLVLIVSLEAIFLSTFVLIKQNRMSRRDDLRAHLDLQINLLSEQEMTLVLQMLQRISTRLGATLPSEDVEELSETTSVEAVAGELRDALPEE